MSEAAIIPSHMELIEGDFKCDLCGEHRIAMFKDKANDAVVCEPCAKMCVDCGEKPNVGEIDGEALCESCWPSCKRCNGEKSILVLKGKYHGAWENCYPDEYDDCPRCEGTGREPNDGTPFYSADDIADMRADEAYDRWKDGE